MRSCTTGAALQRQAIVELDRRRRPARSAERGGGLVVEPLCARSHSSSTCGASRSPSLRSTWKNWNRKRSRVVRGDEGAAALAAHQDVLGHELVDGVAQRADRRRRTRAASAVSLGSASPGGSVPPSMARSSARLTTRYSGMPAASGAIGREAASGGRIGHARRL